MPLRSHRQPVIKLLLAPLLMTVYQITTVLAFAYGPWPWPVTNAAALYSYLAVAIGCFAITSCLMAILPLNWRSPIGNGNELPVLRVMTVLMLVFAFIISIARTKSPFPFLTFSLGQSNQNYANFVGQNLTRGWWTYCEYAAAILSPAFLIALIGVPIFWRRISVSYRLIYLASLAIYIMSYVAIAVNRGMFQIAILLPVTIGIYYLATKHIKRRTLFIFALFGIAAFVVFAFGFNSLISVRDQSTLVGHFIPLDIYADRTGLFYRLIPKASYTLYENVTRYITNGYYGLSLALQETGYRLGYGLTGSMLIMRKANAIIGDQWYFRTLLPMIEQNRDWSMWHLWHSAYTWFISDFGVVGSLGVVGGIGALYGAVWRTAVLTASIISLALLYLMTTLLFYLSANNQVFQTADMFLAFVVLTSAYLCGFFPISFFSNLSRSVSFCLSVPNKTSVALNQFRNFFSTNRILGGKRPIPLAAIAAVPLLVAVVSFAIVTFSRRMDSELADAAIAAQTAASHSSEDVLSRAMDRQTLPENRCAGFEAEEISRPFDKLNNGDEYVAPLPALDYAADSLASPQRSPLLLCEDQKLLGPSHSLHADIARLSLGRYSHWIGSGLIFSSSDGSNPNHNGRKYTIALDRSAVAMAPVKNPSVALSRWGDNETRCAGQPAKIIKGHFESFGSGYAYYISLPTFNYQADSPTDPTKSTMIVCEDGRPLAPMHSNHTEITGLGSGRYSHWKDVGLIFSASDNSNPNTNGRTYSVTAE